MKALWCIIAALIVINVCGMLNFVFFLLICGFVMKLVECYIR